MPFLFTKQQSVVTSIEINKIKPSKYQPRKAFADKPLNELAQSIKQNGVLMPLIVARSDDGFLLVAGERRLRASKLAGLKTVPCIITDKNDKNCASIALIENIQREQLSFFEEAEGYSMLINEYGMTQADIAKKVCKKQSTISNKLRLLRLPVTARAMIVASGLTERHARELLRIPNRDVLFFALDKIIEKKLNVAQTETLVTSLVEPQPQKPQRSCKVGDMRIFINTLNKAVDLIKRSGIKPSTQLHEKDGFVEYIIKILKSS